MALKQTAGGINVVERSGFIPAWLATPHRALRSTGLDNYLQDNEKSVLVEGPGPEENYIEKGETQKTDQRCAISEQWEQKFL